MAQSEKLQAGINALKAGRRDEAVSFLTEAAKENRDDELVWLYLGAALEDPQRKRQAFERALKLNPDNEKAKLELAKLKALASQPKPEPPKPVPKAPPAPPSPPPGTLTEDSGTYTIAGSALPRIDQPNSEAATAPSEATTSDRPTAADQARRVAQGVAALTTKPFHPPFKIDGAPPFVTLRGLAVKWLRMGLDSIKQLFNGTLVPEQEGIPHLSLWDAIMPVLSAAFVFGAAEFVGRLIRGILEIGFIGFGGVIVTPFFAAILGMAAVFSGLLVGAYSGQVLLERQNSRVTVNAHLGSYASAILAAISLEAIVRIILHVLVGITRNGGFGILALLLSLGLAGLIGYLLNKEWLHRYELDDKTINLAALITVGGGWLGIHIVLALFGAIFRIPFF
jgi:hypothetical protein